ncbi:hypothetical protein B0H19DRAFT_1184518 [Mycena capillaripes]|nr:hypothetical protein B0H19DRAFT_1184518 [Mycena capillaripes]
MPGRVHFSSHNTFHSPPPPPLMRPSGSSATSSFGPLTPPPLPATGLPGPTPFVPGYTYSSKSPARAHNLMAFSNAPLLQYDITLHPSSISTHYMGVSSAGFSEPALYPPALSLTLVTPHLPWAIVVPASNGRFVTVSDVLNSVYLALRVSVTPTEFNALGTQKLMSRASAAYRRRYERLRGHRGYKDEKRGGVRRVDFLMGYTKFQGISPTARAADVWQLNFA